MATERHLWINLVANGKKSSSREDSLSIAEAYRQDQKSSVANCTPLPSRSWQWKANTNIGKKDLRDMLYK